MKLPVNKQLLDIHRIMTFIKDTNLSVVGHGKFGMADVLVAWRNFVQKWREAGKPGLFFAKTDIVNCFDSIQQEKLYDIVKRVIEKVTCPLN